MYFKKIRKTYENINLSFFENKKSYVLIARLQLIGILVRTISGPNTYCCFFETFR